MQCSNLTKCGLFFQQSPLRSTHFFDWCCSASISLGIEALILILEKVLNCRYDLIIGLILLPSHVLFFNLGEQKIVKWCHIRRIWRVTATAMYSIHRNHRLVCRSIVLVKQDSICQFSRPFWNVSSSTFQSPKLLIQSGFVWTETMQLILGKVEFNACQVLLVWHNSFSVSLWTFQPTLVQSKHCWCFLFLFSVCV